MTISKELRNKIRATHMQELEKTVDKMLANIEILFDKAPDSLSEAEVVYVYSDIVDSVVTSINESAKLIADKVHDVITDEEQFNAFIEKQYNTFTKGE